MFMKLNFNSLVTTLSAKPRLAAAIAATLLLVVFMALNSIYHFTGGHGKFIDALIERNVTARGGASGWKNVSAMRLSGQMDLGKGVHVPYVVDQKRPGKMCLEFIFNKETAIQCVNGKTGWKVLPFQGRYTPEAMKDSDLKEMIGMTEIGGLLIGAERRGYDITLAGKEKIDGVNAIKLELKMPGGAKRWLYIDEKTALEIKLEMPRMHRGKEQMVETYYTDWRKTEGLLMPRRQETKVKGSIKSNFVTVDSVRINPPIADSRFIMPLKTTVKKRQKEGIKKS